MPKKRSKAYSMIQIPLIQTMKMSAEAWIDFSLFSLIVITTNANPVYELDFGRSSVSQIVAGVRNKRESSPQEFKSIEFVNERAHEAPLAFETKMRRSVGEASVPGNSLAGVEISGNVCKTIACNSSAAYILYNMENTTEPCDNFYRFSCGGFINKTFLYSGQSVINYFTLVAVDIIQQLKTVIEKPSATDEPKYIRIAKDFYKSCMNEDAIERRGSEPLKKILKELGGWPILEGQMWNETNFNWIESIMKFRKIGIDHVCFFYFTIAPDAKNNTNNVLMLDEPVLALPQEEFNVGMNHTRVKAYYELMVDIAVMLGATRENATVELKESLEFEMALAKMKLSTAETRNKTHFYNPMTLSELSMKYPSIPWNRYVNSILEPYFVVDDNEIVIVTVPKFITELLKLIEKTPKRVLANYLMWRVAISVAPYLHELMLKRLVDSGVYDDLFSVPRWYRCVDQVKFFHGTQRLYIQEYFNNDYKNNAHAMMTNIKNAVNKVLQSIDWMDTKTKQMAVDKVAAMSTHIGYPEEFLNDTLLTQFYDGIEITDDNYFENILQTSRFMMNMRFSSFRDPRNRNDWKRDYPITDVNAYYDPMRNSIEIPAGILQNMFFSTNRPKYMNYGAIGSIMGHEISHAFDDEHRQFDKDGNLNNWWTQNSDAKYRRKAKCIIDQFNNVTDEQTGKKVNGYNTQGENIADAIGIRIAYLAYKNWLKRNNEEPKIPGLTFNSNQMYWISAANMWCSKSSLDRAQKNIAYDTHSPDEYRVLGMLRSSPEFAADFECPLGSKMNPAVKCTFW